MPRRVQLIRNPNDRDLVKVVAESRFIASSDLYRLSTRSKQVTSAALEVLTRASHIRRVCSIQRLFDEHIKTLYAKKAYIYTVGASPRGHIVHWLYIAHIRSLFVSAARDLKLDLEWSQSIKHKTHIPDAVISYVNPLNGLCKPLNLEIDNSTEGMRLDRIAGKADENTLIVCFRSRARMDNLSMLPGLQTYHGLFHEREDDPSFNILTEKLWWNGEGWSSLL